MSLSYSEGVKLRQELRNEFLRRVNGSQFQDGPLEYDKADELAEYVLDIMENRR